MKNYIKYFNYISLFVSFTMIAVMAVGYVIGSAVLCASLYSLVRMVVMTCFKVLTITISKVIETIRKTEMMIIVSESL